MIQTRRHPAYTPTSEFWRVPRELWAMLARDRKWWLAPVMLLLLVLGALVVLGSTGAAPLLYTLF